MIEQMPPGLPGMPGMPGMPLDAHSPVFNEPWEARAFAMVLALHQRGLLTWPQWAEALSRQIDRAQAAGDADLGDTYYQHWLLALESLVKDVQNTPDMPNPPDTANVTPLKVSPPQ